MEPDSYFRAGVGVFVVNGEGLILALERADVPGSWQTPQGGIEPGETPLESAQRELREETGISWDAVEMVDEHPHWLAYELPRKNRSSKTGRGQVQKWILVRYIDAEDDLDLAQGPEREFKTWRWIGIGELISNAWPVRRPVYIKLADCWSQHFS